MKLFVVVRRKRRVRIKASVSAAAFSLTYDSHSQGRTDLSDWNWQTSRSYSIYFHTWRRPDSDLTRSKLIFSNANVHVTNLKWVTGSMRCKSSLREDLKRSPVVPSVCVNKDEPFPLTSASNKGPRSENGLLGSTSQRQKQGREQQLTNKGVKGASHVFIPR